MLQFQYENKLTAELKKSKTRTTICSITRGVMFILFATFFICLLCLTEYVKYSILTAVFFLLFLVSIFVSNPFYREEAILKNKCKVYERHKQRRAKETSHFSDTGLEFKDKNSYELSDLDVFGSKSLYQYLCEAKTPLGRKKLAMQLKNPEKKPKEFTVAIDHFANCEDCLTLEAALMEFKKGSYLMPTDEFKETISHKIPFHILMILPFLSFLATIAYIPLFLIFSWNPYILLIFLCLNLVLSKICLSNEVFGKDSATYYRLADLYYDLAKSVNTFEIQDSYYESLKRKITQAIPDLKRIKGMYSMLSLRRNLLLNIVLNLVCSFDFFEIVFFNFKVKDTQGLEEAIDAIAELEVLLSFKNIGMDNDTYCIPENSDTIVAEGMIHPLVKNCVPNPISLTGGMVLTGSNMSGKTTYMRTLGVCQILYNAGSVVPAESFASRTRKIYTSLRANDMLQEGISTFYAEILRMKAMNEGLKDEPLILVDEIFKGTNASERISASMSVIDKFNQYHALFIVSTHDFEICDAKNVENYHFEESYNGDEIFFDYKIKNGRSVSKNAMYLLKMAHIIEE